MPYFFILVVHFMSGDTNDLGKDPHSKNYTHEVVMDEITLSTAVVEKQHIEAICFYSGLGNGNGGTDYVTRNHNTPLIDVKNAIDNSVTDTFYLKVANELSPRRFAYGEKDGKLVLVETVLMTLNIVEGFTPMNMRAASWRKQVQQPVVA